MNWRDSLDAAKARLLTIQSSTVKLPLQARSVVYGATAVFAVVTLFTLPKLWSLRSRELDEKLAVVRVHARHASLAAYERVAGMLPASVMKDL